MVIIKFSKSKADVYFKDLHYCGHFLCLVFVYKHTMILFEGIQTEIMSMQCKTGPINSKLREPRGKCSRIVRPFALFSLQQTSGFAENNPFDNSQHIFLQGTLLTRRNLICMVPAV